MVNLFAYVPPANGEPRELIRINLYEFTMNGEVEFIFSEFLKPISDFNLNITAINKIKEDILFVNYRC